MHKTYEERLAFYESCHENLQKMIPKPRKGEYSEKFTEINERIKELSLNDLSDLVKIIKAMQKGGCRGFETHMDATYYGLR